MLFVVLAFSASGGAAQDRKADAAAYREAIARALQEFNLGHWTEAKVFFTQAHALKPSARTLRGMGLAAYESRNYVEALEHLQAAVTSNVQPLTPDMRGAATRLIEQMRQFVMRVEVELQPASAELRVDGKLAPLDAEGTILLDPGEHELSVLANGFEPLRRRISTEGGRSTRLHLVLTPEPVRAVAPGSKPQPMAASVELARAPVEDTEPEPASGSSARWYLVGGGAALAAAGGVVLALGLAAKSAVEGAEDGVSWGRAEGANDRAVPMQVVGGVLLGVGAVGVGLGLAWEIGSETEELTLGLGPGSLELRGRL